jgi:hypothetical protein
MIETQFRASDDHPCYQRGENVSGHGFYRLIIRDELRKLKPSGDLTFSDLMTVILNPTTDNGITMIELVKCKENIK